MKSISKYTIVVSIIVLLSFGYLFYRDAILKPSQDLNISECVPFDVKVDENIVTWKTMEECVGYVKYGYEENNLDLIAVNEKDSSGFHHTVEIDQLDNNAFAVIYSNGIAYGNDGSVLRISN